MMWARSEDEVAGCEGVQALDLDAEVRAGVGVEVAFHVGDALGGILRDMKLARLGEAWVPMKLNMSFVASARDGVDLGQVDPVAAVDEVQDGIALRIVRRAEVEGVVAAAAKQAVEARAADR